MYTWAYRVQYTFTRVHARIPNGNPRKEKRARRTSRRTSRRGSSCVTGAWRTKSADTPTSSRRFSRGSRRGCPCWCRSRCPCRSHGIPALWTSFCPRRSLVRVSESPNANPGRRSTGGLDGMSPGRHDRQTAARDETSVRGLAGFSPLHMFIGLQLQRTLYVCTIPLQHQG